MNGQSKIIVTHVMTISYIIILKRRNYVFLKKCPVCDYLPFNQICLSVLKKKKKKNYCSLWGGIAGNNSITLFYRQ